MAKICPRGHRILYIDCLECDDKICKLSKKERYFKLVDDLMFLRGFKRIKTETNYCIYEAIKPELNYSSIKIKVLSGKRYLLLYNKKSSNIKENIKNNKDFWKNIKKVLTFNK